MTDSPLELSRNCSSDHQFLFCKTDKKARKRVTGKPSADERDALADTFPDMLTGDAFLEQAMAYVATADRFGALVVRIDRRESSDIDATAVFSVQAADTIRRVCSRGSGLWGRLEADLLGCIFPGVDGIDYKRQAGKIQEDLRVHNAGSVTIGIAGYPTIDFPKNRILDNARKALDHAAFFGPGSVVCFDAVSLNISGDQYYQEDDIEGAVEEFQKALELDPVDVNVHNSLGVCYGVRGDYRKAAAAFETATRLDPSEPMSRHNQGLVYLMAEGDREKALDYFLKADAIGDEIFEVAFQIGKLYLELEKPEKGKGYLEKAAAIRPSSGIARRYLGDCYEVLGMTETAVSAYKSAVKQNPNDAEALSALGFLLDRIGENSEIVATFYNHSVEIAPENGLFRYRLGTLHLKEGDLEQALAAFRKARELGHDSTRDIERILERLDAGTNER